MTEKNNYFQELTKLLLPTEIFEYFEIVNLEVEDKKYMFILMSLIRFH